MNDRDEPQRTEARDQQAERHVIGAMLTRPHLIDDVFEETSPAEFADPRHIQIAQAIADLHQDGQPVSLLPVVHALIQRGQTAAIGNDYLAGLTAAVDIPESAPWHARRIHVLSKLRRIHAMGTFFTGLSLATDPEDLAEALAVVRDQLEALEADNPARYAPTAEDLLPETLALIENPDGARRIPTGLSDIDQVYPGFAPGQSTLIAARPSVGKSLLGLNFARHPAIELRIPTLFVSLEMDRFETMQRLISAEAKVDHGRIRDARLTDDDWERIAAVSDRVAGAPLYIDDTPSLDLPTLRNTVRTMRRGPGCELVIIDYLQLMTAPRAQSREQAVAQLSRGLKLLAREFRIPVIALCQLNRESEKRTDKRPQLSDLRESGSLEQDADNVILLHRPEMYGDEARSGEIDVIYEKVRAGAKFTATLAFQGHYSRVMSMARDWSPSSASLKAVA